jgi:hypothetical protein
MKPTFGGAVVRTTVGDLVASIMEASLEVVKNEKEASVIAAIVLDDMLGLTGQNALFTNNHARAMRDA